MQNEQSHPDLAELFHQASRTIRARWRLALAPLDITPHQSRVLAILGREESTGLRNSHLAQRLHITPRSTTEVVDQLVAKNLVQRASDPLDRRATLIALSEQGRACLSELSTLRQQSMRGYFDKLDAADQQQLAMLLSKLTAEAS